MRFYRSANDREGPQLGMPGPQRMPPFPGDWPRERQSGEPPFGNGLRPDDAPGAWESKRLTPGVPLLGGFTAPPPPDGRWRTAALPHRRLSDEFKIHVALLFLAGLLANVPLAWWFSRRPRSVGSAPVSGERGRQRHRHRRRTAARSGDQPGWRPAGIAPRGDESTGKRLEIRQTRTLAAAKTACCGSTRTAPASTLRSANNCCCRSCVANPRATATQAVSAWACRWRTASCCRMVVIYAWTIARGGLRVTVRLPCMPGRR